MKLTNLQKQIGAALVKGPKTAEEIAEELDVDIQDVLEALKGLILLRLVKKEGNPPVYSLADHVKEALRVEEGAGILVHAVLEVQGVSEEIVRNALEKIREKLEGEEGFITRNVAVSDIEKDEELSTYYGHIDATLLFPALEPLVYFLFFYGPTVIEVLTTEKIQVDPGDLQRAVLLAASMIHGYVDYISRKMTREEIEEFNKRLYREFLG